MTNSFTDLHDFFLESLRQLNLDGIVTALNKDPSLTDGYNYSLYVDKWDKDIKIAVGVKLANN